MDSDRTQTRMYKNRKYNTSNEGGEKSNTDPTLVEKDRERKRQLERRQEACNDDQR